MYMLTWEAERLTRVVYHGVATYELDSAWVARQPQRSAILVYDDARYIW